VRKSLYPDSVKVVVGNKIIARNKIIDGKEIVACKKTIVNLCVEIVCIQNRNQTQRFTMVFLQATISLPSIILLRAMILLPTTTFTLSG
jgi:hypothetical protein